MRLLHLMKQLSTLQRSSTCENNSKNNEPDGFVTEAYKSFKDKVCYRVDFK